jgi:hypothetical protein
VRIRPWHDVALDDWKSFEDGSIVAATKKYLEITTVDGARRRQSSGPGELSHSARTELHRSMSRREDGVA